MDERLQRHMYPRRNAVVFQDKFPKSAVGILDIRLTQARDLGQINCTQSPDAFAMFYIHPVPGLIRRSTTIDLENGIVSERWLKLVMNLEHYQQVQEMQYRGQVNIEVVYRSYMDEEAQLESIVVPTKVAENEQEYRVLNPRYGRTNTLYFIILVLN
jgi:hypothetical protein